MSRALSSCRGPTRPWPEPCSAQAWDAIPRVKTPASAQIGQVQHYGNRGWSAAPAGPSGPTPAFWKPGVECSACWAEWTSPSTAGTGGGVQRLLDRVDQPQCSGNRGWRAEELKRLWKKDFLDSRPLSPRQDTCLFNTEVARVEVRRGFWARWGAGC